VSNATVLIWKVPMLAERRFRRLDAPGLLADVHDGRLWEGSSEVDREAGRELGCLPFTHPLDVTSLILAQLVCPRVVTRSFSENRFWPHGCAARA
jgi:hypothetical protein